MTIEITETYHNNIPYSAGPTWIDDDSLPKIMQDFCKEYNASFIGTNYTSRNIVVVPAHHKILEFFKVHFGQHIQKEFRLDQQQSLEIRTICLAIYAQYGANYKHTFKSFLENYRTKIIRWIKQDKSKNEEKILQDMNQKIDDMIAGKSLSFNLSFINADIKNVWIESK